MTITRIASHKDGQLLKEITTKYIITYNGKKSVRIADSAEHAIDKLCDQYGWRNKLDMYDADTRGKEWARCSVDTNGGINWDLTIYAERSPRTPLVF